MTLVAISTCRYYAAVDRWRRVLTSVVGAACERAGAPVALFAPWVDLAALAGPTPVRGPLRHDILLPAFDARQAGINVFQGAATAEAIAETARGWAASHLGAGATAAFDDVLAMLPRRTELHAGGLWEEGQPRLKLYLTGAEPSLRRAAEGLVLRWAETAMGLGVDITGEGATRARLYCETASLAGWDAPTIPPLAGLAHQLIGVLGEEKRSLNLIFTPGASLTDLVAAAGAVPVPRAFDQAWLEALRADHLCIRPAAYEVDLYPSRRRTDLLITVGESS